MVIDPQLAILVGAISASIATLIAAVTACIIAIKGSKKTDVKLDQIHVLVNSRLSVALTQIAEQRELIAQLLPEEQRKDLTQKWAKADVKMEDETNTLAAGTVSIAPVANPETK